MASSLLAQALIFVAGEVTGLGPASEVASSAYATFASPESPLPPPTPLSAGQIVGAWTAASVATLAGVCAVVQLWSTTPPPPKL